MYLSAAIMIEAIYELTRAKMKETEIDGVPRTKNQVCYHVWPSNCPETLLTGHY